MLVNGGGLAPTFAEIEVSPIGTDVAVITVEASGLLVSVKLQEPPKRKGLWLWPKGAIARASRIAELDRVHSGALALERARASTWNWDLSTDEFHCGGESQGLYGHGRQPPPRNGATWLLRIHREDRDRVAAEFERCRDGRSNSFCIEYRVNLDETRTRWVLTRGALAELLGPESRRMVGMSMDVTALHPAAALSEVINDAQARPIVEALEQVTGGIASDLNNLLSTISNFAELQRGGLGSTQVAEFSRRIIATAAQGALLTRKLSLLGKLGGACTVGLSDGLAGISSLMRRSAGDGVNMRFDISADAWPVHVDPAALQLAFVNLAISSGHAMPDGGTFTLSSVNSVLSGERSDALYLAGGDFVQIEASDTGTSLSADALSHVFEPDFVMHSVGGKVGPGLAQVRQFALQSGGAVQARSILGGGTTITLYLPRAVSAIGMKA